MRPTKRRLYKGNEGADARYELAPTGNRGEFYLRLWDVVRGDAPVFLTPARTRRLIADLARHAAAASATSRRTRS